MTATQTADMPLSPVKPGRWTTIAGPQWCNPGGALWGGYAIGLAMETMLSGEQADPDAVIALLRRMRGQFYDAHRPTDDTL